MKIGKMNTGLQASTKTKKREIMRATWGWNANIMNLKR